MRPVFLLFLLASLLSSFVVHAQQQDVIPTANVSTAGGQTFLGPLTNSARTYQLLINENQLTNVVGREITSISFRLPPSASAAWPASATTYSNYDIYLSPGVAPVNRSLASFASNATGAQIPVRSGSLSINPAAFPSGGNPNNFGTPIQFYVPYLYSGGHLLIEIRHNGSDGTSSSIDAVSAGNDFSACWTGSYTGTSGSNGNAAVIQLTSQSPTACTVPPDPGVANSNKAAVCAGESFNLSLSGNSSGTGQTYQWQSSVTGNAPWTDVNTPEVHPYLTHTQTTSTWYRAAVTCGGITEYSDSIKISTPALVNGDFTINNALPTGAGNFESFAHALDYIKCGIDGPVTFTVEPGSGPYTEQVEIPQIFGASQTNRITIRGNGAIVQFDPVTANRHIFKLNGADYVTIDSLEIKTLGTGTTSFGWGVHLTNGADYDSIKNCIITIGSTSVTQSNSAGIVASGSATSVTAAGDANYNVFSNNIITGAYQGIIISGTAAALNNQNHILSNLIQDFYATGVLLTNTDNTLVKGNDISRANRTVVTTFTGVQLGAGNLNAVVDGNKIHDTHNAATTQSGDAYAIHNNSNDATVGNENKVINNLIYNFNSGTGLIYALHNVGSDGVNYYHNTIVLDHSGSTAGNTRGFYQTTAATRIQFRNNIVYINRGGSGIKYCIYLGTTSSSVLSDNNVLYNIATGGTNGIGSFGTAGAATLLDWQAANSGAYDQQSVSTDPQFAAPGSDYTPTTAAINDIAPDIGVTEDITGAIRSANPDPGAYEFSLPACTNPPTAGDVVPSVTVACAGELFSLDLTGHSVGNGILYYWQSSPTGNAPWTSIAAPQTTTQLSGLSQTTTTWYRAGVECNGGTIVYNTVPVQIVSPALISGTFTINNALPTGSGNFESFADALNHIKCGIDGAVIFNVAPGSGPYTEQVIIPEIFGSSVGNTITFNGNGATVSFTSTNTAERAVIKLNGADYIIIDSLDISAGGSQTTEYGYGVQLVNDADNNIIRKCTVSVTKTPATASSNAFAGIVVNAATATSSIATGDSKCDNNTITGNTVTGGFLGVAMVANGATDVISNNKVTNNVIQDFYQHGVYVNGNDNILIEGNDISRPTRTNFGTSNFSGVYFTGVSTNSNVSKNRIHNPYGAALASTGAAFCIYFNAASATAGSENIISNNLIYDVIGSTGNHNGILINNSSNLKVWHNTIVLNDVGASCTNCAARGIYVQNVNTAGLDFRNNIIDISQGGDAPKQCIFFEPLQATVNAYTLDGNNYYITSTGGSYNEIARVGGSSSTHSQGTGHTTIAGWQAAIGQEANSKSADPLFSNPSAGEFIPQSTVIDNIGIPVGITTDINGAPRSPASPDAGAFEFTTTLPVTWLRFEGEVNGQVNTLVWTTSTEVNNKGFEVERSGDGTSFRSIGFVATKAENNGNSTSPLHYSFDDVRPLGGVNYYRLRQVDRDGRTSYSKVITLERKITEISFSSVYPNPAMNSLNLVINAPRAEQVTIIVTDLQGKMVIQSKAQLVSGTNNEQLNVRSLAAGTYVIKAVCSNGCETAVQRFVKQ